MVGSHVDVTTIKNAEENLKRLNEELEHITYIAAHDLKSPIANIDGFLRFLKEDEDIKKERSLAAIEWIDKSVNRANNTIQGIVKNMNKNK